MQQEFAVESFCLVATPICQGSTLPMEERGNPGKKMLSSVVTDLSE